MRTSNVTTKPQIESRRGRSGVVTAAASSMLIATALFAFAPSEANAARRTTKSKKVSQTSNANYSIAIREDAITTTPSSTADYVVILTKGQGLKSPITFDVPDLPGGYSFEVSPLTASTYRFRVTVPSTAPDASTVYVLRALNGGRERASLFRLTIQSPPKPTVAATVTTVATTTTTLAVSNAFAIKADVLAKIAGPGETVAFPITIDRQGYVGPVAFIAEGQPSGSVVGYSPNPTNGNTTLYITPQDSTPSGRFLIVVTAKIGSLSRSTAVQLTVRRTSPFTSVIGPLNIQTTPGNDARFRVDLAGAGGPIPFVEMKVSGLPTGAALSTVEAIKAQNTLLITTSASTPIGTYPILVTLTSGTFTSKGTVSLVIAAGAGFSVTPETSSVLVPRGGTTSVKVTVLPSGGFTGALGYAVTGLPTGAQASYEVTSTGLNLKVAVPVTAPTGSFPFELVTSSGTLATTTSFVLVVS